jgi:hypothetical protein
MNEMGSACSTHGRASKYIRRFAAENLEIREHLEDLGVDGRIILKCILKE